MGFCGVATAQEVSSVGRLPSQFTMERGHLQVPERPGLGSDLIESELLKHPAVEYPGAR